MKHFLEEENTMEEDRATPKPRIQWLWWAITALLGAGLVIDIIDGPPLKIATSGLLFAACFMSALAPPPRRGILGAAIISCFGLAILIVLYRVL